ncbi:MAG TPA: NAD(P)-dependent oxidoreductase [Candidatus Acidoferrales bacterium]|jgi:3-hydroxyisobutyrate dehydrogenase-like beta-hydroxyacid dehydrogenase|nr:NAD(P)-dependent oxidoreductase [Candidatus Acidoferrales bacterium]
MDSKPVGMIGLGIMGSAMSANLIRAGFKVVGYDVVSRALQAHRKVGGAVAHNCQEVATKCDILVTSLPSSDALLETAAQLAKSSRKNQIVVETSTLPIPVKEEAREILASRGTILLDCTLSGTGAQARVKDLIVYASGDRKACDLVAPVMQGFARAQYYVGAFGAGSKMKFVANLLVAIHNVAAAEAMVLAMKSGLDPELVLKVVADGAGGSRMLQVRGPMMVKGDYSDATMKVQTWQKDMTIIGDYARKIDCPTPLLSASASIYTAAMAMGLGAEDTGAVCAVLERMANNPRGTRGKK